MLVNKQCTECGGAIAVSTKKARGLNKSKFCSTPCAKKFNNRRQGRGARIYDLAMSMRKNRRKGQMGDLCHQIGLYLQQDALDDRQTFNDYENGHIPYDLPTPDKRTPANDQR